MIPILLNLAFTYPNKSTVKNLERETFSLFWQQSIPKFQLCDPCADFDEKKSRAFLGAAFLVLILFLFLTSDLPSVTHHINSSGINSSQNFPLLRLDSMKKLLFCVSVLKSLFDLFPNCVYRFSKIVCKVHLPRGLNHCKFLVISGSSREISEQSNCRY